MILIDANEANIKKPVGSNIFVQQVIKHLASAWTPSDPPVKLLLSQTPQTAYFNTISFPIKTIPPSFFWTQWRLPLYLYQTKPKLIFTPGHYAPRFKPKTTKSIITIFDLAYLHFPDQFLTKDRWQLTNWTKYSAQKADHIITISQSTKKDIIKHYHVDSSKITIAYPGHRLTGSAPSNQIWSNLHTSYNLQSKKFFLFVGTLQPRKNITNLINAFLSAAADYPEHKLVLVGRPGWLYQDKIKPTLTRALSTQQVIWLDFVDDYTLATLYHHAYFLVLPSLWEGFGMPVIEAAAFATPALVSAVSSLTEIVTNPNQHIKPPFKTPQIKTALIKMLKLTQPQYGNLQRQAVAAAAKFRWPAAAEIIKTTILNTYHEN
ncbi:MAG: glycosyltransferase family 4 protein [bacterium]|nr:glycosyltransferase family 4 protein [bacterium]